MFYEKIMFRNENFSIHFSFHTFFSSTLLYFFPLFLIRLPPSRSVAPTMHPKDIEVDGK